MSEEECLTEDLFEKVLAAGFSKKEQEYIRAQRAELRRCGVTREPLLTQMACEFASVLMANRGES